MGGDEEKRTGRKRKRRKGGMRWEGDGVSPASTPRSASGNHGPLLHRLKKRKLQSKIANFS